LGVYPGARKVQARTRAFLVLSHAEVESYLEDWAKEIARKAEVLWTAKRKVSTPLLFLHASLGRPLGNLETLNGGTAKDPETRLSDSVVKLFQDYYSSIKDNHGIKEKNVLALFTPLGISKSAFSATLAPGLDSLGAKRGTHAHYSAKSVTTPLDPESTYKEVVQLVDDLKTLDAWLISCKQQIR
jgi:hypothetical protein